MARQLRFEDFDATNLERTTHRDWLACWRMFASLPRILLNPTAMKKFLGNVLKSALFLGISILDASWLRAQEFTPFDGPKLNFDLTDFYERNTAEIQTVLAKVASEREVASASELELLLNDVASQFKGRELNIQAPNGRMPLPTVLIGGIASGLDNNLLLDRLAMDDSDLVSGIQFTTIWRIYVNLFPNAALASLDDNPNSFEIGPLDVLRLISLLSTFPGEALQERVRHR